MEVTKTLDILDKAFINATNHHDKILSLQQKFVYALHKREYIEYHIKYRLYLEALIILTQPSFKELHQNVQEFIRYFESLF
jgi:hypothetical protein